MSTPFIGEIKSTSFGFAPKGWALCNGQTLPVNQNQALYAVIGNLYGGDSVNFALPDLRGRAPMHQGAGVGLTRRTPGQAGGEAQHTLTTSELPTHTHSATASTASAMTSNPQGATWAATTAAAYAPVPNGVLATGSVSAAGNNQAHENRPPYLVINYVIALTGIYPSRG